MSGVAVSGGPQEAVMLAPSHVLFFSLLAPFAGSPPAGADSFQQLLAFILSSPNPDRKSNPLP